jgi:hypothetical protein
MKKIRKQTKKRPLQNKVVGSFENKVDINVIDKAGSGIEVLEKKRFGNRQLEVIIGSVNEFRNNNR